MEDMLEISIADKGERESVYALNRILLLLHIVNFTSNTLL